MDPLNEEWLPLDSIGFPGYQISNVGNLLMKIGRLSIAMPNDIGYITNTLIDPHREKYSIPVP